MYNFIAEKYKNKDMSLPNPLLDSNLNKTIKTTDNLFTKNTAKQSASLTNINPFYQKNNVALNQPSPFIQSSKINEEKQIGNIFTRSLHLEKELKTV